MIPQPFSQRLVGELAVYYNIKKNTWISWIHLMRVLAAYGSSERQISIAQMAMETLIEKTLYVPSLFKAPKKPKKTF